MDSQPPSFFERRWRTAPLGSPVLWSGQAERAQRIASGVAVEENSFGRQRVDESGRLSSELLSFQAYASLAVVPAVPVGECEHSDPDGLLAGRDRRSNIRSTAVLTSVSLGGCSGVPLLNMPAQSKSWLQRSAVRATPPTLAAAYLWVVRSRYLVVRGAWRVGRPRLPESVGAPALGGSTGDTAPHRLPHRLPEDFPTGQTGPLRSP